MSGVATIRRVTALLLLVLWWGGFTFYASRVIFIGHEVLRSKVRQGFITERVTTELNWLALAALAMTGWELASSSRRKVDWTVWTVATITTIGLIALHAKLTGMLNFGSGQVSDDKRFYAWHRVYLCIGTIQWLAGALLLVAVHIRQRPIQNGSTPEH